MRKKERKLIIWIEVIPGVPKKCFNIWRPLALTLNNHNWRNTNRKIESNNPKIWVSLSFCHMHQISWLEDHLSGSMRPSNVQTFFLEHLLQNFNVISFFRKFQIFWKIKIKINTNKDNNKKSEKFIIINGKYFRSLTSLTGWNWGSLIFRKNHKTPGRRTFWKLQIKINFNIIIIIH